MVPGNQRREPQTLEARQVVDPHARKQALRDRQRAETQELPAGGDPEPLGGGGGRWVVVEATGNRWVVVSRWVVVEAGRW